MLSYAEATAHYQLVGGYLYRRLKNGLGRRLMTVREGRLLTRCLGRDLYGPDLAWTLYYGVPPMFPVFTLDGDPHNLAQENVVAARIKRLRYRPRETASGFKHALNPLVAFASEAACHDDWIAHARRYYAADHATVRELEEKLAAGRPAEVYVAEKRGGTRAGRVVEAKPPKPAFKAGWRSYWFSGQWVTVPEACHPADDWFVRCSKVLAGAVQFAFNPATEQVEGFDTAGAVV